MILGILSLVGEYNNRLRQLLKSIIPTIWLYGYNLP